MKKPVLGRAFSLEQFMNLLRLELVLRLDIDKTGALQMLTQGVGGYVVVRAPAPAGRQNGHAIGY
jgi:hypothetical protein